MGKRKKAAKPQGPKKREPLSTTFSCLFCNHEKSITCKLDKKSSVGTLHCKVCAQTFQTDINSLSAPVDVYSDWIDACDAVTRETANAAAGGGGGGDDDDYYRRASQGGASQQTGGGGSRRLQAANDDDDDDDDGY
ncbi:transcription elongation factor Elf1 like-domain-containing protein [Peziza echinospora]|nr:transcription elongation factor Elf1 like-domain-containing protein [Peziza echinospora]